MPPCDRLRTDRDRILAAVVSLSDKRRPMAHCLPVYGSTTERPRRIAWGNNMMHKAVNHSTAVMLLLLPLAIQSAVPSAPQAAPVVLIKAGRLIDVNTGQLLRDQAILVEGERIKEVGSAAAVGSHAPAGVRVIDLGEATALPGLIDVHVHLLQNWKDDSVVA